MQNIEKLFELNGSNSISNVVLQKNVLEIRINQDNNLFTGEQIKQIINIISVC